MKWKGKQLDFHICHQLPERSFFYKGEQFPVCARCTGFYAAYTSMFLFAFNLLFLSISWSFALFLPATIDGVLQATTKYNSNNWLRLATGLIAGVGFMSLTSHLGKGIGSLLLKFF